MLRRPLATVVLSLLAACSSSEGEPSRGAGPSDLPFASVGSLASPAGKGSFRFGVATAATQIEDQDTNTDWWWWTAPTSMGGLAKSEFVGDASKGYTKALDDVALLSAMHLDSYRFSIEWARVEPKRGEYDEAALAHYSQLLDALRAAGLRPVVTLHHFSNPVWVDDPRDADCKQGPTDANLCGLGHPQGGPLVVDAMKRYAKLIAERFGDRVDEWGTLNEPVNYLVASQGIGQFPPGKTKIITNVLSDFLPVVRDCLSAHAAMYAAIKEADTVDADGDGSAADVGLSLSVADFVASRDHAPSEEPADVKARDAVVYVYHHLVVDSLRGGTFDADLDGTPDEQHPEWKGTIDWLGAQYYFRSGVTGKTGVIPVLNATPCFGQFDFGACLAPQDRTWWVPAMKYEYFAPGLYDVLADFGQRWPDLPLVVSEGGIATDVGARRAENVVRTLEQIARARAAGVDVRGYYHWSLYDNFEWSEGYAPHFGLYRVDFGGSYERTPTEGATVYGAIAGARTLVGDQRTRYGGDGPMTPEPGSNPPSWD